MYRMIESSFLGRYSCVKVKRCAILVQSKKNRGNLLGVYGMAKNKKKKSNKPTTIRYFDYSLLAVMVFLICFGLVMLYSTVRMRHRASLMMECII